MCVYMLTLEFRSLRNQTCSIPLGLQLQQLQLAQQGCRNQPWIL